MQVDGQWNSDKLICQNPGSADKQLTLIIRRDATLVTANWGIGAPMPSFLLGVGKFTYASHAHSLVANYYAWPFFQVLWFIISYAPCFRPYAAVPYASPSTTPRHHASPFSLPS